MYTRRRASLVIGLVLLSTLIIQAGIFMEIDGIAGESSDGNHTGWVDVDSLTHGVMWGGGQSAHSPVTVTYTMDKTAPIMNMYACTQNTIDYVVIELTQPGDTSKMVYRVRMENVTVSGTSTSTQTNGALEVALSFDFDRIRWSYQEYDISGSPGALEEYGWIVSTNCPWN